MRVRKEENRMIEDDMMILNEKKRLYHDVKTSEEDDGMMVKPTTFATLSSRYMIQPNVVENYDDSDCVGGGKRFCGPYRESKEGGHHKSYWRSWDNDDESNIVPNTMEEDNHHDTTVATSHQHEEEEIHQLMDQWTTTFDGNNTNNWARLNLKNIRNQYHQHNHDTDTQTTTEERKRFFKNKRREARRLLLKGLTAL